ncbi:hypothetical protein AALO_G00196140, partial [Alosa alosa]
MKPGVVPSRRLPTSPPDMSLKTCEITMSLAKMIVKDLQPISQIPKLYEKAQKTAKDSIQSASSLVLTTSMW